jgi:hypothetical protein
MNAVSAFAVAPGPAWAITSLAQPTIFSTQANENCEKTAICDSYTLLVTNTGGSATNGSTISVADNLPSGVVAKELSGVDWERNGSETLECTVVPLRCTETRVVPPDDTLEITVRVEVTSATGTVTNEITATGGGASATTVGEPTVIGSGTAPFDVHGFSFDTTAPDGAVNTQAGEHPYEQSTGIDLTTLLKPYDTLPYRPTAPPKNIVVTLPAGFLGNPQATPRCPLTLLELAEYDFNSESPTFGQYLAKCPRGSRIGVVATETSLLGYRGSLKAFEGATSVFNIEPEGGHAAELGFRLGSNVVLMYADLVRTGAGYRLRVTIPGIPLIGVFGAKLTIFGQPGAHDGEPSATQAFVTNPTRCTNAPLMTRIEVDSWEEPSRWVSKETAAYPRVGGCDTLQFNPEVAVRPETTQADAPSGYEIALKIPRAATPQGVLQSPQVKDVTLALPAGLSVSPSAADGLQACEATGPRGIDIPHGASRPDEAGEGEAIGSEGLSYLTPGHCPHQSQIGEVEVVTPLLAQPLKGHLYVAQPKCGGEGQPACTEADATNGNLFGLYLEVGGQPGEETGVVVKLEGTASVDPTTGQVTASFRENPQVPFSELRVRLNGGPRAPLANPQGCGTYTATSDFVPWSTPVTPDATPFSTFAITGCTSPMPFAPSFEAGTMVPDAAASGPFTLTLARRDGEQDFLGIATILPPGLVGMISKVPFCGQAQANAGSCPEASKIGTTTVAAGAGSHPFWISGKVYLTGPYNGAPFGLSVVVPTEAGPFNLGAVVVRAAINVDPTTAAVTVTSGPIPQIRDGVPFRLKTVNVLIDRPGFMLNPTDCEQQSIAATIAAAQGAGATVLSPFEVAGCASLPFKPSFTVSTQAKTSKANGASLDVKVAYPANGQANIKSVKVDLPKQLPSRLTTLQKACTVAVFESNPAKCPPESIVGIAKAQTPVLPVALTGPAYLVSHAAEAFPNLVVILQGEGVRVDLTGNTLIRRGVTSSTFSSIPDVPVTSFELFLPEGHYSVLTANGNLCKGKLQIPTKITGQNGAVINRTTVINVSGCSKAKKAKRARKAKKTRRGRKATHVRTVMGRSG